MGISPNMSTPTHFNNYNTINNPIFNYNHIGSATFNSHSNSYSPTYSLVQLPSFNPNNSNNSNISNSSSNSSSPKLNLPLLRQSPESTLVFTPSQVQQQSNIKHQ